MHALASLVCQLTPTEQAELWSRQQAYKAQFAPPGAELLSSYQVPVQGSELPNLDALGPQAFLKSLIAKGSGPAGFLKAVMDGDLGKLLPEGQTFGNSAAPAAPQAEAKVEPKEEKTNFDVVLKSFTAESKLKLIKEVKTMLNIGLKEAKDQVESSLKGPVKLYKNIAKADAEAKLKKLKETGADIVLE